MVYRAPFLCTPLALTNQTKFMRAETITTKSGKRGRASFIVLLGLVIAGDWLAQTWLEPKLNGNPVEQRVVNQTILANGIVLAPLAVDIASQVNGKVLSAQLSDGQAVHAGQTLLVIENAVGRNAIDLAEKRTRVADARFKKISSNTLAGSEHSVRLAKSAEEKAKSQYTRINELVQRGMVESYQSGEALRNLAIAQNQLANMQFQAAANRARGSDYALAEIELSKARAHEGALRRIYPNNIIAAESDGVLLARDVKVGSQVKTGQKLLSYLPSGKKLLSVQVEEKDFHLLKLGQHARVYAQPPGREYILAELTYISPGLNKVSGYAEVKLSVNTPAEYLLNDMLVSVDIEVKPRNGNLAL